MLARDQVVLGEAPNPPMRFHSFPYRVHLGLLRGVVIGTAFAVCPFIALCRC